MFLKLLAGVPLIGASFSRELDRVEETTTNVVIVGKPVVEITHLDVVAMIAAAAKEIDEARSIVRSQGALTRLEHARDMLREVEEFFNG